MSFNSSDVPSTLYSLVDEQGGGILSPWIKYARSSGDYSILEEYLDTAVKSYLYNGGKGKLVPISQLVTIRNKQRNALLGALRRKKGRGKSGPNILEHIDQDALSSGDFLKALKVLDGGMIKGRRSFKYRELVWDMDQRGRLGENLLHVCMLLNTADMNELVKQMTYRFPKIVNDIFLSEEYYGLSPLHQAIVNEDLEMVYFLCRKGADVHQRCYGSFFCADDQKASRTDSLEHEWVDLVQSTKYTGQMYWGEYPLSFAACTNQVDCFRLLRAMKADPNMPDTNGNTVLHLTVIHDLPEMFMLAVELGANLHVRNNLKLTPLALAARLAKKHIYDLILECDMDISWRYGPVVCKAYPLNDVDTINESDGSLNPNSVIANVVYGDKVDHLEFFDGLIEEVLESKWETFGKKQLFMSLAGYIYFLAVFYLAFMTRDAHILPSDEDENEKFGMIELDFSNFTNILSEGLSLREHLAIARMAEREALPAHCHLWDYSGPSQQIRMISEILCLLAVVIRTFKDCIDAHRTGVSRWWNSIKAFPEKVLHKFCQILVLCTVPLRVGCYLDDSFLVIENLLVVCIVIMSTLHFLFYCRSLKFVGPFVLMVYKIIVRDMLRFLLIYSFFLMGFAQAFFVIFKSCERAEIAYQKAHNYTEDDEYIEKFENIMEDGWEAVMRMFIMSVGEFGALYKNLNECKSSIAPQSKVFFILFELIVTVMLLNLLIAMMTRTYEKIAETEKEWKRQWAQVILMLEQSSSASERLLSLYRYTRPIRSDKRRRAFVVKVKSNDRQQPQLKLIPPRGKPSIRLSNNSSIHVLHVLSKHAS
ncbi:Ion transport domain-containing protein [Caenorhabditis elegans]|uniref:Ion transport domain-containing protein n=1 Tax=Caenorhabditis elegans TaxID=6239 RepID=Q22374_CAEEL|nr:Ion transport domain-containing protein [Caenorhabditis elegans]CAA96679.5 Ion transport domain-containing protein [Caenorhabditis elegans]|eukprot:NP_510520.4 Osm-9 and Capsaicin receptor-Related [Caenorhabditis elegans]